MAEASRSSLCSLQRGSVRDRFGGQVSPSNRLHDDCMMMLSIGIAAARPTTGCAILPTHALGGVVGKL